MMRLYNWCRVWMQYVSSETRFQHDGHGQMLVQLPAGESWHEQATILASASRQAAPSPHLDVLHNVKLCVVLTEAPQLEV
jgi:hypothetical protein